MDVRRTALVLAAGALAAVVTGTAPAVAAAPPGTPPTTGCPAGQLLSVAELETAGPYRLPRQLDTDGNQDGNVCGKALAPKAAEAACGGPCPVPVLYLFRDNDLAGYTP